MSWIAENALMIWVIGAIALSLAGVIYWETRSPKAQAAIGIIVLITAALLVTEWLIETPREAVTRSLRELAAAVERNDVQGTLSYFSPQATKIRADIEKLMPEAEIQMARIIAGPEIEFDNPSQPTQAVAKLRGAVNGKVKQTSLQGTVMDDVTVHLKFDGQRWLIDQCDTGRDWSRELRH